jgi:hypothetical protein
VYFEREVAFDEVYVVAGYKGNPEAVKKNRPGGRDRFKEARGKWRLEKEKPPVLGMIHRNGLCFVPGCDRAEAFLKKSCLFTSLFLNWFIILKNEVKAYLILSSGY